MQYVAGTAGATIVTDQLMGLASFGADHTRRDFVIGRMLQKVADHVHDALPPSAEEWIEEGYETKERGFIWPLISAKNTRRIMDVFAFVCAAGSVALAAEELSDEMDEN